MPEISRRELLKSGALIVAGLLVEGCQFQPPKPAEILASTKYEVVRLANSYPEDSIVRTVYLGDLQRVSPVFKNPLRIGIADPNITYARTHFGEPDYSRNDRFRYALNNGHFVNYQILEGMKMSIFFSPVWLASRSDEVKKLALEKEGHTVAQWEGFSRIALNTYLSQGKIEKIDPKVTEAEIGRTLARNLLLDNPLVAKLFNYAGYLPLLSRVGILLEDGVQIQQELSASNFPDIYKKARAGKIKFDGLEFNSREFYEMAFTDSSGLWVKMISDPAIPAPAPLFSSDRAKFSRKDLFQFLKFI